MDAKTLIPLPVFDVVAQTAAEFLLQGKNVAVVGPPGTGATSVGFRIQRELSAAKFPYAVFDCTAEGEIAQRLAEFPGPKREPGQKGIILIDHATALPLAQLQNVVARVSEIAAQNPTALLCLGALDTRTIKTATTIELHTDTRTHLCLPELGRDDLLRLYRAIATRKERQWGEAMLYFALDWCGNDLALADGLIEHFYGNWTERIYDDVVAECLRNWLKESEAVRGYRQRFAALSAGCKEQLRHLCGGGKLISHRPEVHLETSEDIRRFFLDGFVCANLLPGYHQFRNLTARFIVEEHMGLQTNPIDLLRRAANSRVNLLLQDAEVSLRGMLKTIFRQMPPDEVKKFLTTRKAQQRLFDKDFRPRLMDWAGQQSQPGQPDLRGSLATFLTEESAQFDATNNLWMEACRVFREAYGLENTNAEPTPEQAASCLTFKQLSDLLQAFSDKLFIEKPRSKRMVEPPSKRWPGYLARVNRLRNDAAHLRNISFQDIEDLLQTLDDIRQDQLDFGIIP